MSDLDFSKTTKKSNYELYGDAADEIERLHDSCAELRNAHSEKCAEIERLRAALKGISECDGQTLLGCAPEHEYEPDLYPEEERAHQYGAYKAFNQCAAIAKAALKD